MRLNGKNNYAGKFISHSLAGTIQVTFSFSAFEARFKPFLYIGFNF